MKVIFLDVDGVLNYHGCMYSCGRYIGVDPEKVGYLKQIVDSTGAIIVLTSTWKSEWESFKELQDSLGHYLDRELAKFGLKIRSKTHDCIIDRGAGIKRWIAERAVESFVIMDDNEFDFESEGLKDRLVKTDFERGLTREDVEKAEKILNKTEK